METGLLDDELYLKHTDLLSQISLQDGSYFLAQGILTAARLEQQWHRMNPETEISLREKRAQVFALLGDTKISINERIQLASLLTKRIDIQHNQDSIWRSLMSLPQAELHSGADHEVGSIL